MNLAAHLAAYYRLNRYKRELCLKIPVREVVCMGCLDHSHGRVTNTDDVWKILMLLANWHETRRITRTPAYACDFYAWQTKIFVDLAERF